MGQGHGGNGTSGPLFHGQTAGHITTPKTLRLKKQHSRSGSPARDPSKPMAEARETARMSGTWRKLPVMV